MTLARIPVIGMLAAASMIGGFGTPVGLIRLIRLIRLVRLARDPQIMGHQVISRRLAWAGGAAAALAGAVGLLFLVG